MKGQYKDPNYIRNYYLKNQEQRKEYSKNFHKLHRETLVLRMKKYYNDNKEKLKELRIKHKEQNNLIHREYRKKFPWLNHLEYAKNRCNTITYSRYKDYGGRGIKCLISKEEIKELWFRDKAYDLKQPSIDRIDNDGNYEFNNCQFIELSENTKKRNIENKRKKEEIKNGNKTDCSIC